MTQLQRQAKPRPATSWMLAGTICLAPSPPLLAQPEYSVTDAEEPTRYDTRIVSPADNAAIPMGPGNFTLQSVCNPRLASGEILQLALDGEPVGAPQQAASCQLSNFYRGEHRLQVVRLDENGAQFDASAVSTVYVLRPSVNS